MRSLIRCYISFISGMMVGFELVSDDNYHFIVVDLFIVQLMFEWDK
jgi:hypothetical protein